MVNCAIATCRNTSATMSKDRDGITFHRFPREKERRRLWEIAVNREKEWSSTNASTVCSAHFDSKYFYLTESGLRRLSRIALPSVNLTVQPTLGPKPSKDFLEILPTDSEEVIQLKHKVNRLQEIAANRKQKLNLLWQDNRKLKKKLDGVNRLLEHLIKKKENTNIAKEFFI